MKILTRYVLLNWLTVFLVTLAGMTLTILGFGVVLEAVRQGLGLSPVLRLFPYLLPNALRFAVPGTALFAACTVFGRMAAANEVVAVKAAGISPNAILAPAFVAAFLVSLVAVWLNDVAVSWGKRGIRRVVLQSMEQIAYGMLRSQGAYQTRRFSLHVAAVQGKKLIQPTLVLHGEDGRHGLTLTARSAELQVDLQRGILVLKVQDSRVVGDRWDAVFPGLTEHTIPLSLATAGLGTESPSELAMRQIPAEKMRQARRLKELQGQMAVQAALYLASGHCHGIHASQWSERYAEMEGVRRQWYRLEAEPWRRWANGFSCLCFVLVGAPLAIRLRTADVWSTFGLCFLPILVLYYPLLAAGVDRAKTGLWPGYSVWLGNVILVLWGLWLWRRVLRY